MTATNFLGLAKPPSDLATTVAARLHFLTNVLDRDAAASQAWDFPEPTRRIAPAHAHSRPGGDSRFCL